MNQIISWDTVQIVRNSITENTHAHINIPFQFKFSTLHNKHLKLHFDRVQISKLLECWKRKILNWEIVACLVKGFRLGMKPYMSIRK